MTVDDLRKWFKVSLRMRGQKRYATLTFLPGGNPNYHSMLKAVLEVWPEAYITSYGASGKGTFRLNP